MGIGSADRSALDWPVISAYAYQCQIGGGMISQAYQQGQAGRRAPHRDDRARTRAIWLAVLAIACNVLKYIVRRCRIAQVGVRNWRPWFERLTVGERSYLQRARAANVSDCCATGWHGKRNWRRAVREANGCGIAPVSVGNHAQQLSSPSYGRIAPDGEQNRRATVGIN